MAETRQQNRQGAEAVKHKAEDLVGGKIQAQVSKVPSDTFLWLAAGSIAGSLALRIMGRRDTSLFVGQWAPTFIALGLFDKLTEMSGSESYLP